MTNFEYIKNMSVEEMAKMINQIGDCSCDFCKYGYMAFPCGDGAVERHCISGTKQWLESERKK